jgi:hypothetical protein
MSDCKYVNLINGDQCIGDSLRTINANFSALEAGLCDITFNASVDLSANDGLTVEKVQVDEQINFAVNIQNSVQFFKPPQLQPAVFATPNPNTISTIQASITQPSNSIIPVLNVPYSVGGGFYAPPLFTFETISMGNIPPSLTIYWLSSAQSPNFTYATNAYNLSTLTFNGYVHNLTRLNPDSDSEYIFAVGNFTTASWKGKNTTDYALRIAPLRLDVGTSDPNLGKSGSLTAFFDPVWGTGGSGLDTLNILNSNQNTPSNKYYGFNKTVFASVVAKTGGRTYLCLGGDFSGGGNTLLDANTSNLVIFNITSGNVNDKPKEFQVNGRVRNLIVYQNYLYVCGQFTKARPVGGDYYPTLTVFRVDLSNLQTPAVNGDWIDKDFSNNFNSSYEIFNADGSSTGKNTINPGNDINSGPSYQPKTKGWQAYCLAIDPEGTHLYVGGNHYRDIIENGKRVRQNYGLTVHALDGKIVKDWKCKTNGTVTCLRADTIYDDTDPTKPLQTVLYVGGYFNSVAVGSPFVTYNRPGLACFQLTDFDNTTGFILDDHPADPRLNTDWFINLGYGSIRTIGIQDKKSNSPLYIGGDFKNINGNKTNFLAAISKPNEIGGRATLYPWNLGVNGPVYTMLTVLSGSSMNDGIDPESKKRVSLLIGGNFTRVLGQVKPYLARVNCYNEVPTPVALSSVLWEVAGQSLDQGSSIEITADTTMVMSVTAGPADSLNVTKFPPFTQGFENISRGDLCRFVVSRPLSTDNLTDTYAKAVHVVGVSLDYNTDLINLVDLPQTSPNFTLPES